MQIVDKPAVLGLVAFAKLSSDRPRRIAQKATAAARQWAQQRTSA